MKTLDQTDPLPKFDFEAWNYSWCTISVDGAQPRSKRDILETQANDRKRDGEDWRPTDNPLIEINGKGQMRTKDYPIPPEADIPIPCVVHTVGFDVYVTTLTEADALADLNGTPRPDHPSFGGWVPHKPGDPMPCEPEARIAYRMADFDKTGLEHVAKAANLDWGHCYWAPGFAPSHIIAWKPAT
jgi:hypothetical protein